MNIEKINKFLDYIYDEKSMCWYGENLEEEDIIRLEDDYGRV